jgi:hypothetical protein
VDEIGKPPKPTGWRFTIRGFLTVTAILAVAAAPIGWLGGVYVAALVISSLLVTGVAWSLASGTTLAAILCCVMAPLVTIPLFFVSSVIFLQSLLTAIACLATIGWKDQTRHRLLVCGYAKAIAYVFGFVVAKNEHAELVQLRNEWPVESITQRLVSLGRDDSAVATGPKMSTSQTEALERIDRSAGRYSWKTRQLSQLHDKAYSAFAMAQGFGVIRMPYVTARTFESKRRIENVQLPSSLRLHGDEPIDRIHGEVVQDFTDPERLGYVESPERVVGFEGHAVREMPGRPLFERQAGDSVWRIDRLELIGLVLGPNPRAYVSKALPDMSELRETRTRELSPFELSAISQLHDGQDLVIKENEEADKSNVMMVGPIRAGKTCQPCHDVPYGSLLGAFSYDLTREGGVPALSADRIVTPPLQSRPSTAD